MVRSRGKVNVRLLVVLLVVGAVVVVGAFAGRDVRRKVLSARDLRVGQAAFEAKDWKVAGDSFHEYLGRHPDDSEVLEKYAQSRLKEGGHLGAAVGAYQRLLQLDPGNTAACERLAEIYKTVRDYNDLAYLAGKRLEAAPGDVEATLWQAQALVGQGKNKEAGNLVELLLKKPDPEKKFVPEYVEAYALRGFVALALDPKGGAAKARPWFDQAVSYAPVSAEARLHRARFLRLNAGTGREGEANLAAAEKDLEQADALNPADLRTRLLLGEEWLAHGRLAQAEAELAVTSRADNETICRYFLEPTDWPVDRFLQAAELTIRQGKPENGPALADEVLAVLKGRPQRLSVLPSAIRLYVAGQRVADGRRCLDDYQDLLKTMKNVPEARAKMAYLQAIVFRAESRFYAVIDLLEPVTAGDNPDPTLLKLLAEAYSRTDQSRRAIRTLGRYLRQEPRDADMNQQLVREYIKQRDWNRALETSRLAEPLDKTDMTVKLLRLEASVYGASERPKEVSKEQFKAPLAELAALRRAHPEQVDIRILQSTIAINEGHQAEAEQELKTAIKECKDTLPAELQLARLYYQLKRWPEAIQVCRDACARHPEKASPWESLAEVLLADQKSEEAQATLEKGLQTVTDLWEKYTLNLRLSFFQLLHGQREKGIARLKDMASQFPLDVRIRSILLSIPEVFGDATVAQNLLSEMRKAEGENGVLWRLQQASLWLASADWRSHQQDIADDLNHCIAADPEWSDPVLRLAFLDEKLGRLDQAEDVCRRSLTANPTAVDVAERLVSLLESQHRFAEAAQVLNKVESDPRVLSAQRVRANLGAGKFNQAIEELKLRAAGDAKDADSRILLARLTYWETKDVKLAMKYLDEAQKIAPDSIALMTVRVSILKAEQQLDQARSLLDRRVDSSDEAWRKVGPKADLNEEALRLRNATYTAHVLRGTYLASLDDRPAAEKDFLYLTTLPKEPKGYELLGRFYADSRRLDDAVATLAKGLAVYPDNLVLQHQLMNTLFARAATGDREQAEKILAELGKRLPNDPDLLWTRGRVLLGQPGQDALAQALKCFEQAVQLEPTLIDGHLALIQLARQRGDNQGARDLALRALGANPNNSRLTLARASAELALNNTAMAQELARTVLKDEPGNLDAYELLTEMALKAHDSGALAKLREALEALQAKKPDSDRLAVACARVVTAQGKITQAVAKLETYTQSEAGRRSLPALLTLAELHRTSGDLAKASQDIDQAAALQPDSPAVVEARVLCLADQKKFDEVRALVPTLAAKKIETPQLLTTCADVLAASGDDSHRRAAVLLYEKALSLAPQALLSRLHLALLLYQMGEVDQAEKNYREVLTANRNNCQAINDLAWILSESRRDYKAALELADRGLTLEPDNLHLLDTRGVILRNMDRAKDARKDFERLLELVKQPADRARALLQLGRTCAKLNSAADVKRCLDEALQIDHQTPVFTPQERKEIEQLKTAAVGH
jgi:predicted Zn-dependent protease